MVAKWITGANNHGRRWLSTEEAIEVENNIRIEFAQFVSDLIAYRVVVFRIYQCFDLEELFRELANTLSIESQAGYRTISQSIQTSRDPSPGSIYGRCFTGYRRLFVLTLALSVHSIEIEPFASSHFGF